MGISRSFISVAERLRRTAGRLSAVVALLGLLFAAGAAAAQAQPATADVDAYLESGEALNTELLQGFFGAAVTNFGAPHVIHTFREEFFGSGGTAPDPVVASEEFLAIAFAGDAAVGVVRIGGKGDEVAIVAAEDSADLASALATRELVSADSPLVLVADPRGEGWLVLEDTELTTLNATPKTYSLAEYSERVARNGGGSGLGPFAFLQDPRVFGSLAALILVSVVTWLMISRQKARKPRT